VFKLSFKSRIIILVVLGLLVYGNALGNGFVWDDEEIILNNPQLHSLSYLPNLFAGSTFNSGGAGNLAGLYYKPFMMVSFAALYTLFGPQPFVFHLFQLLLHIANSIIVFLLLKRFLKRENLAFFLSLIFLVHPINTETVVYSADLQDVLFFFFGGLALLVKDPLISGMLVLGSLLSKETGAIMALLAGLNFAWSEKKGWQKFLAALAFSVLVYSFLRFGVAHIFFQKHGLTPISTMPFSGRLINIPAIIFFYLKTFLFPLNLSINQQWAVRTISLPDFWFPLIIDSIFILLTITVMVWLWGTKSHWLKIYLFFFLWFFLALGFHLQLFPLDLTVSDRWFYLPIVGLLGMGGVGLVKTAEVAHKNFSPSSEATRNSSIFPDVFRVEAGLNFVRYPQFFTVLGVLVIFLLSLRTFCRTFDWRNGLTLYSHDIVYSRNAFDLENNYGVELFRIGKLDEAAVHFEKSIGLSPRWWTSYNNLGAYYEHKGDLVKAEELYKKSIANGQYYLAYENLAFVLLKEKKYAEDIAFLGKSLPLLPQNPRLVTALALAFYQNGQKEKAVEAARYLLRLSPLKSSKFL